jgi:hypothetical protein
MARRSSWMIGPFKMPGKASGSQAMTRERSLAANELQNIESRKLIRWVLGVCAFLRLLSILAKDLIDCLSKDLDGRTFSVRYVN